MLTKSKSFRAGKANPKAYFIFYGKEAGKIQPKLILAIPSTEKKTDTGEIDNTFSLRYLMGSCRDFLEEETALQFLGRQLGVQVKLTPKFHAELAGEGVEYSWAHAKGYYRRKPLAEKKEEKNSSNWSEPALVVKQY